MPRAAEARAWWDEVEDVRKRIERRQASARNQAPSARELRPISGAARVAPWPQAQRERNPVRAPQIGVQRRTRRPLSRRLGPRPDRIAAWAVWLGLVLVVVAVLSARS
jgi:hypothetical protein